MTMKYTIRLSNRALPVQGFPLGMAQPALRVQLMLELPESPGMNLRELNALFSRLLGKAVADDADADRPLTPAWLLKGVLRWNRALQGAAGWPAFSDGFADTAGDPQRPGMHAVLLPCVSDGHHLAANGLAWVVEAVNLALAGEPLEALEAQLPKLLQKMQRAGPQGMNTLRFLQAAHDAGIPWRRVRGNVYQFGWGARARWLDSSFTERTSRISSVLARNKLDAAAVLRRAGVPVPDHVPVKNAEEAVKVAERMGYPVVVKPVDLDGGKGVAPGLRTAEAVAKAYAAARKLSPSVMLEKHVEGNDYRLQVFQGKVFWATHRIPGGVTGDGRSTVSELLAALNADPKRAEGGALLKRIALDEEASALLAEQGLTPDAVPAQGAFVRLRRAANVASGGQPVPALEGAHPDNLALAARAARVLRLDLAGVDLLIPDIRRSWLETGAAVCEVNAQPQLWPTLPARLLAQLVRNNGRIPVIVVVGRPAEQDWARKLADRIGAPGVRVGLAARDGVRLGGETLMRGPCDAFAGGEALLLNPDVDAAILCVDNPSLSQTGLPFDHFDLMILAGASDGSCDWPAWRAFAQAMSMVCRGAVLANSDCPEWTPLAEAMRRPALRTATMTDIADDVAGRIRPAA